MHGWIMAGQQGADEGTWSGTNPLEAGGYGGVAGLIDALKAIPNTPYATVTMNNPVDVGSPIRTVWDHVEKKLDEVDERNLVEEFGEALPIVQNGIDGVFDTTTIANKVEEFNTKGEDRLDAEIARVNVMFSDMNSVNSSTRGLMVMMLEREHNRSVDDFDAGLRLEIEKVRMEQALTVSWDAVKTEHMLKTQNVQYIATALAAASGYAAADRQYVDDQLRLTMEDLLWDIKLYDFANQALGAIAGASVIPGHPNPTLEGISGAASAIGALSPLLIAIGGKL
jgi:hypothetical protein